MHGATDQLELRKGTGNYYTATGYDLFILENEVVRY
jgi:hypothetical protein